MNYKAIYKSWIWDHPPMPQWFNTPTPQTEKGTNLQSDFQKCWAPTNPMWTTLRGLGGVVISNSSLSTGLCRSGIKPRYDASNSKQNPRKCWNISLSMLWTNVWLLGSFHCLLTGTLTHFHRMSFLCSAVTEKPPTITRVRSSRGTKGLCPEHNSYYKRNTTLMFTATDF